MLCAVEPASDTKPNSNVDEHEVWLKGDPLTFVADSAESAEKQVLDFLGAVEKIPR